MDMQGEEKKVVQTELTRSEHEMVASAAKSKNLTLKQAVREALLEWATSEIDLAQDPLFKLRPTKFTTNVRADRLEEFIYRRR